MQDTSWASITEAAQHFGVSPDTIRRMISRGEIDGRRFGPRLIRVRLEDVIRAAKPLQFTGGDAE